MRWRQLLAASVAVFALVALADVCGLALRPAHAASEFERGLKRHLLKAVAIDRDLDAKLRQVWGWDTTPAQLAVLRPYMRAVFRHPQFPGYLAGNIQAVGPMHTLSPAEARNASTLGMLKLQASGLARLPSDDQAVYVRHLLAMARELPANTCREVSDPDTTALRHAQIERESLMRIPVAKLAEYYKVAERAALAELDGHPAAPNMTAEREWLANDAFERLLEKRMFEPITGGRTGCEALALVFETMLELAEPYRTWYFQVFLAKLP